MVKNYFFTTNQHGLTAGRSCTTQLLTALNYWTKSLEESCSVDIIYFNFAKAFDLVPHIRLFTKLESYDLAGNWLRSFLKARSNEKLQLGIIFSVGYPKTLISAISMPFVVNFPMLSYLNHLHGHYCSHLSFRTNAIVLQ